MPLPRLPEGVLEDISLGAEGTVWAVGTLDAGVPLVLRWREGRWERVAAPRRRGLVTLQTVRAGSSGVWVGGGDFGSGVDQPVVVQRRNGDRWENVPGARIAEGLVYSIDASSETNAWAVGYQGGSVSITTIDALALRWDGRRWLPVRVPPEREGAAEPVDALEGVAVVNARRAWAVGTDQVGGFALLWNGARWARTNILGAPSTLAAVAAAAGETQAVGTAGYGMTSRPVALRWNGRGFARERISPAAGVGSLHALVVASREESWAVGGASEGLETKRTLVLRRTCR